MEAKRKNLSNGNGTSTHAVGKAAVEAIRQQKPIFTSGVKDKCIELKKV